MPRPPPVPAGELPRPRPFLKWAGGKADVLPDLRVHFPERVETYYEPFLGGGAVALDVLSRIRPARAVLGDRNSEVVDTWVAVRDHVEPLIERLAEHAARHDADHYARVRAADPSDLVECAARTIYLNKTCFNGLYRINRRGLFNVPLGRHPRVRVLDADLLRSVSRTLAGVTFRYDSFEETVAAAGPGDLVYLDPPYDVLSDTASFTAYDGYPFTVDDQREVATVFRALAARGARVVASNHDTPRIRQLYAGFEVHRVEVLRRINVRADGRGRVGEVVVVGGPR